METSREYILGGVFAYKWKTADSCKHLKTANKY